MNAAEAATLFLGNDYWRSGALAALSRITPTRKKKAMFCSHLVASAYEVTGITLVQDKGAEKITPADIAASPILESVTDSVLEPIAYESASLWGRPLEKVGHSPHRHEVDASRQVRDYVHAWLRERGLPEQENFYKLLNFLRDFPSETIRHEMDEIFCRGARETSYFEVLGQRFPPHHPSFQASSVLRVKLAEGTLTDQQRRDLVRFYEGAYREMLKDSKDKPDLKRWFENAWNTDGWRHSVCLLTTNGKYAR